MLSQFKLILALKSRRLRPMNYNFKGRRALITGGLGFIGSNLALKLVELGAHVTLVDAMIPEYGGNPFNIEPVKDKVTINYGNICDAHAMNWLVRDQDYVFHLAGQVSHVKSLHDPFTDIEYNIKGTATLAEAMRTHNPKAKLVFTGTRGQYGSVAKLPAAEDTPVNPKGIYEITNLAAEQIIKAYHRSHNLQAVLLRLTNIYGPRGQMKHSQFGVVNWFVRLAIDGKTLPIFGDGKILRDFVYVDDCVDAILMAAAKPEAVGEIFNVGTDKPSDFLTLAKIITSQTGKGRWEFAPFSEERKAQEPGDFYSDISKIRSIVGWEPKTNLEDGIRQTITYYQQHQSRYWP